MYPVDASVFAHIVHQRDFSTPWGTWKFKAVLIAQAVFQDAWDGGLSVLRLQRKLDINGDWIPVPGLPGGLGPEKHAMHEHDDSEDEVEDEEDDSGKEEEDDTAQEGPGEGNPGAGVEEMEEGDGE